ncbi:MAG: sugar phosphate isomerase/epimerase [Gemmataceae bacterium]|nr:sugar phosphate isomerase/epimerase [Gemmataceae bacterium]MDW8265228.1 sugar phosphate isomerase/epimerase family protein [Gemmataceae bacterium]
MRYAICNETFEGWEHARVCRLVADLGYSGLEVAPFTLAPRITDVPAERRRDLRRQAEDCGLKILGLHWLLAKTEGLHVTSPDAAVRRRTADYLVDLARACRDLGGDLMVFGSPLQRRIPPGASREQAVDYLADTFSQALPGIAECGVTLCLEPLAPSETDLIQSCAEAVAVLDRLRHPNLRLHQDVKAMSSEGVPIPELIRRYADRTAHFHANDANRRGPGFGDVDFVPIFRALKETNYAGWVSVEVFDYTPDPETIARESIRYMRECEAKADGGA